MVSLLKFISILNFAWLEQTSPKHVPLLAIRFSRVVEASHLKWIDNAVVSVSRFWYLEAHLLRRSKLILFVLNYAREIFRQRSLHFEEWWVREVKIRLPICELTLYKSNSLIWRSVEESFPNCTFLMFVSDARSLAKNLRCSCINLNRLCLTLIISVLDFVFIVGRINIVLNLLLH